MLKIAFQVETLSFHISFLHSMQSFMTTYISKGAFSRHTKIFMSIINTLANKHKHVNHTNLPLLKYSMRSRGGTKNAHWISFSANDQFRYDLCRESKIDRGVGCSYLWWDPLTHAYQLPLATRRQTLQNTQIHIYNNHTIIKTKTRNISSSVVPLWDLTLC